MLAAAPIADDSTYVLHMTRFVESFVLPSRRDRWLFVLTQRPKRADRDSHKLRNDLDYQWCRELGGGIAPEIKQAGVFYEFRGEPKILEPDVAEFVGWGHDAIYSLSPGHLALFFFHEFQSWLCRR